MKIFRRFQINGILKNIYYILYVFFHGKIRKVQFNNIEALYFLDNYEKILIIKNAFANKNRDESIFLGTILSSLQPGDVAYDIGAAYGLHTIFLAKHVGEKGLICAVEPVQSNYVQLQKNIIINRLNNVIPLKIALGDRYETRNIMKPEISGIGTFSFIGRDQAIVREKVDLIPGEWLVRGKGLPVPKAIKLDIEGFEYPALLGLKIILLDDKCRLVCCEIHSQLYPNEITPDDIIELLRSYGFLKIKKHNRGCEIHAIFEK